MPSSGSGSGISSAAGGHKRHVGINPCLACTTDLNRPTSSTGSKFDHFFTSKADRPEGFDAALIFTPRLGDELHQLEAAGGQQSGSMTPGVQQQGSSQQVGYEHYCGCLLLAHGFVYVFKQPNQQQAAALMLVDDSSCESADSALIACKQQGLQLLIKPN
jgi:hypothetical protein